MQTEIKLIHLALCICVHHTFVFESDSKNLLWRSSISTRTATHHSIVPQNLFSYIIQRVYTNSIVLYSVLKTLNSLLTENCVSGLSGYLPNVFRQTNAVL